MIGILFKGLIALSNQATGTALHSVLYMPLLYAHLYAFAHARLMNSTVQYICVCFTSKHKIIVSFYILVVFFKKTFTFH